MFKYSKVCKLKFDYFKCTIYKYYSIYYLDLTRVLFKDKYNVFEIIFLEFN
jgi:hypothetical protein